MVRVKALVERDVSDSTAEAFFRRVLTYLSDDRDRSYAIAVNERAVKAPPPRAGFSYKPSPPTLPLFAVTRGPYAQTFCHFRRPLSGLSPSVVSSRSTASALPKRTTVAWREIWFLAQICLHAHEGTADFRPAASIDFTTQAA